MRKALTIIGAAVAVALLAWGGMHVFISPVNPAQEAPANHFDAACWTCHLVLDSAPLTNP